MIIKRILCTVKENSRTQFFKEQQLWQPIARVSGFLGQVGGWSQANASVAIIYSFWESEEAYQRFMDIEHDQIFLQSDQAKSYESIDITVFKEKLSMPGSESNMKDVLKKSTFIRVALTQVKEQNVSHFTQIQDRVWNTGLKEVKGMLGGTFAVSKNSNIFFVCTGWENDTFHEHYMNTTFQKLYKVAAPTLDVEELLGEQITVEETWRVCSLS